jgi:hypothetical protein
MRVREIVFNAVIASVLVCTFHTMSPAQPTPWGPASGTDDVQYLSGWEGSSLRYELRYAGAPTQPLSNAGESRRSVPVALALSAAVPGAGQVYNKNWIKAGIGAVLEVVLWTGYFRWKQQGEEMRVEYREYAHGHYDPVRYAEWLNSFPGYNGEPIPTAEVAAAVDMSQPERWSREQERMVRRLFDDIQAAERQSYFVDGPQAAFSHELPHFGEQQYYELIGKYYQYAPGWDDCGTECTISDPSERFFEYAGLHGEANTLLRRASRVTAFVIINHSLAAIDAAITAQLHNNGLDSEVSVRPGSDGRLRPYLRMAVSF